MTAKKIDGRAIAAEIEDEAASAAGELRANGIVPGLAVVLVGEDAASHSYVVGKAHACKEAGIHSETFHLAKTVSQDEVLDLVGRLNEDSRYHGILVQLPLPDQIDNNTLLQAVDPRKDVDGLHPVNLGHLMRGETDGMLPCTPSGVVELLMRTGNDPAGKHVVIIGRSTLVGRPLAILLSNKARGGNATVTIAHTQTSDLAGLTREADILVAAAGHPGIVTKKMVKPGAVVIDVGTNRVTDSSRDRGWRLVGDVNYKAVLEVAGWITPVPGGVGPMTIAMLLSNTIRAARKQTSGE